MKDEYRKRLDQIAGIFAEIATHAGEQARERCPYKDRNNACTAGFGCRNQRRRAQGLPVCAEDGRLDYRTAWQA